MWISLFKSTILTSPGPSTFTCFSHKSRTGWARSRMAETKKEKLGWINHICKWNMNKAAPTDSYCDMATNELTLECFSVCLKLIKLFKLFKQRTMFLYKKNWQHYHLRIFSQKRKAQVKILVLLGSDSQRWPLQIRPWPAWRSAQA